MKAHELANHLLKCENLEVTASVDISISDNDSDRRIFTNECFGINSYKGDRDRITICFGAEPKDNYDKIL